MQNFERLSHYDFELLVADLLSAEWDVRVESFPAGPDGGVDLRVLGPAGRHHEDRELGIVLGGQGAQGLFQPRSGVPGDHHRHHRRCTGVHQDAEAIPPPELRPRTCCTEGPGRSEVLATVMQN